MKQNEKDLLLIYRICKKIYINILIKIALKNLFSLIMFLVTKEKVAFICWDGWFVYGLGLCEV